MAKRYGLAGKYYRGKKQDSRGSAATTARIAIFTTLIFMACLARYADIPLLSGLRQGMNQTLEANTDYIGAVEVLGRAVAGESSEDENAVLVFGRKLLGLDGDEDEPSQPASEPETTAPAQAPAGEGYTFPWEEAQGKEAGDETDKATAGGYSGLAFEDFEYTCEAVMPVFLVSHSLSSSLLWDEMDDDTPDEEFTIPSPDIVDDTVYSLPFKYAAPATGRITSYFGYRIHPISGNTTFHHGADLGVATGTTVKAFANGTVSETGEHSVYGKYIKIEHEGGFISMYAHLDKILVKKGKKVSLGDKIAESGNTGYSTGAHLHFELRLNGRILNPFDYLSFE